MSASKPIAELKCELAREVLEALRGWTPTEAYNAIKLDPSRFSDLRHGRLKRFSTEKLIAILHSLGRSVTINVATEKPAKLPQQTFTCRRLPERADVRCRADQTDYLSTAATSQVQ